MSQLPILVAGGGIAGLASAISLARRGHAVLVLERENAFNESGAGLQLGPNAVSALRAIGAWDAVEPITSQPPEILIRDGRTGQLLKRLQLTGTFEKRYGAPYCVAHRADLHRALLETCNSLPNISLQAGCTLDSIEQDSTSVRVNTAIIGSSLLGADGVHSMTRQKLFPKSEPVNSGLVFHRSLQSMSDASGPGMDCVTLWMLPGSHVVHYPVGLDRKLNLVCVTDQSTSPLALAMRSCTELAKIMGDAQWIQWPGLFVAPLQNWKNGRVQLIGDAAHGTLPFLAQGAAMALEDAAVLDVHDGICTLPTSRLARTAKLHRQTVSTGRIYHMSGIAGTARNSAIRILPDAIFNGRLSWLYRQET